MDAENPWAPLGLPPTWKPNPFGWNLAKLKASGPAGDEVIHVLVISTDSGTQGYKLTTDELRAMATKMLEQCTGLELASTIPTNGHGPPPRNRDERRHGRLT